MEELKMKIMALGSILSGTIIISLFAAIVVGIPYWVIKAIL